MFEHTQLDSRGSANPQCCGPVAFLDQNGYGFVVHTKIESFPPLPIPTDAAPAAIRSGD